MVVEICRLPSALRFSVGRFFLKTTSGLSPLLHVEILETAGLFAEKQGWDVIVTFGGEEIVTFGVGIHSGEIAFTSLFRGWWRSGERALRNNGEPGSAFLVRLKGFLLTTVVEFSEPEELKEDWFPEIAKGLGERVGDDEIGDGEGVLTNRNCLVNSLFNYH